MNKAKLPILEGIPKKHTPKLSITYKPRPLRPTTKGVTICFRLSYDSKKLVVSSGFSCQAKDFKDGKVKGNEELTSLLKTYQLNFDNAYLDLKRTGKPIDLKYIASCMNGTPPETPTTTAQSTNPLLFKAMDIYVQKIWLDDGLNFSPTTKIKAVRFFRSLKSWITDCFGREDIEYNDIKPFHDQEIIKWVKTHTKILTDGHDHAVKHVQRLKGFFDYAIQNEWTTKNPFLTFKPKTKQKEIVSLSKMELLTLEKEDFLAGTIYDLVRDLFVFSCYTGLGYADLKEVGIKHLKEDEKGNIYLEIPRLKNGQLAMMLLREKPLELIKKYRLEDRQAKFFNVPTNQCMNDTIKQIAQIIGIKKVLTTHIARKTFGSLLKEDGMDIAVISKAMAHKNIQTTMRHYANIQSTTIINAFLQLTKNQ